jgi:plasmid stabilization system protein ParE
MYSYADTISGVLDELATLPGIGKSRDDYFPGKMSYPAGEHVVFFAVTEKELVVYRIIHSRRDIDAELNR